MLYNYDERVKNFNRNLWTRNYLEDEFRDETFAKSWPKIHFMSTKSLYMKKLVLLVKT